jgi:hypothetical protein
MTLGNCQVVELNLFPDSRNWDGLVSVATIHRRWLWVGK